MLDCNSYVYSLAAKQELGLGSYFTLSCTVYMCCSSCLKEEASKQ